MKKKSTSTVDKDVVKKIKKVHPKSNVRHNIKHKRESVDPKNMFQMEILLSNNLTPLFVSNKVKWLYSNNKTGKSNKILSTLQAFKLFSSTMSLHKPAKDYIPVTVDYDKINSTIVK